MIYSEDQILAAAKAAYEADRAFSVALGDKTDVPWEWTDELTKKVHIACAGGFASEGLLPFAESPRRRDIYRTVASSVLNTLLEIEETLPGV